MTLTREARVDRTAFYGSRPYSRLRAEFERRRQALQQAGDIPDLCEAQIATRTALIVARPITGLVKVSSRGGTWWVPWR